MKYFEDVALAYLFITLLMVPVIIVLYNAYGLGAVFFIILPLLWLVLDSEANHNQLDEYLQ